MTIDRMLSLFATIVSVVAVPASGYFSYWYAIKGEKRKEFNLVTENLRYKFREQLRLLEQNLYPAGGTLEITEAEIDALIDVSKRQQSEKIIRAWDAYKKSLENSGSFTEFGDYKMHDADSVKSTISKLMRFIKRQ